MISCDQNADGLVHEQIAQVMTFLALDRLHKQATTEVSRRACSSLMQAFYSLTQRRLRGVRRLIRNGGL